MGKNGKFLLIALTLGVAAACTYLFNKSDVLIFSHRQHQETGAECLTCHPDASTTAVVVSGRFIPNHQACASCHDEEFMNACAKCHTDPQKPLAVKVEKLPLIFSHQAHAEKSECKDCHRSVAMSGTRDTFTLPGHAECCTCHEEMFEEMQCSKCHEDLKTLPGRSVAEFTHRGNYLKEHRISALKGVGAEVCGQCHDQAFCSDCHSQRAGLKPSVKFPEAVERQFIHRGDYVTQHQIDARMDQSICLRCHGLSSCNACHEREGVGRGTSTVAPKMPADHLEGDWANAGHGPAAKRNILKCASCHDQGMSSNCVQCHQVGGVGGNPHPAGWGSKLSQDKAGVCLACHR